jgi:hypothetical protein
MKATKIFNHVCGSPCHVNMVFSSKAGHVCNDKDPNMLIQALGRGCDRFLTVCCIVNNARLLSLLDNPVHSQGSPCLFGGVTRPLKVPTRRRDQGHKLRLKTRKATRWVPPNDHAECICLCMGGTPASYLGFALAIILIDFAVNGEGKRKQPGSRNCHTVEDIYTQTEILLAYALSFGGGRAGFRRL